MGTDFDFSMILHKFQIFLTMGGYGVYVWSAYGIALLVFVGLLASTVFSRRRLLKKLKQERALNVYASDS